MALRLPTPDDARQPAIADRDFDAELGQRDGARPMPDGEAVIQVSLDDVMPTSPQRS